MRAALLILAGCSFHGAAVPTGGDAGADGRPAIDARACSGPCVHRTITVPAARIGATALTDFPLLLSIDQDASLKANARGDGFDIGFADATGGALDYERMAYDATTGRLVAWIRLPAVPPSTDYTLAMTYGDATVSVDQQRPRAAWGTGYAGVYHLEEATGQARDATKNNNHATPSGGLQLAATGMVGNGIAFRAPSGTPATYPALRIPDAATLHPIATLGTLSAWVWFEAPAAGRYQTILTWSKAGSNDGFSWTSQADGDHYFYPWSGDTQNNNLVANPFVASAWYHVAITLDYAMRDVKIFINGAPAVIAMKGVNSGHWTAAAMPADWLWGWNPAFGTQPSNFVGRLDEIRLETTVRSASFIAATYANQRAPAAFYVLGDPVPQ